MTFKSLKRIAVLSALFLFSLTGLSDDTELFTGANINNNARPQVMIILDTSGSMGWDAPKADYDANTIYSGDYTSNGIHIVKFDSDLVTEGSPCNTIWVEINGKNRKRVECIGNYLNWFEQDAPRRITLARESITQLINDNQNVDFGLAAFIDGDYSGYGGYIRHSISENGSTIVNDLSNLTPDGGTPLCGAYYEVLNFFTGRNLYRAQYTSSRDTSVESQIGSQYKTTDEYGDVPLVKPCQNLYIIYVTDGEPSSESSVNSTIKSDTNLKVGGTTRITACDDYEDNSGEMSENCLPKLAEYLANPGSGGLDNDSSTGNQKAFTYTIGFATDQQLLRDTADKGNGVCYTTVGTNTDSTTGCVVVNDIAAAFQGALGEILQQTSTFVSPAVAVNSFKRTESLDNAYYAMFLPSESSRWTGNLKKLKIYKGDSTPGCTALDIHTPGIVVDRGCDPALDDGSNRIADGRSTYWNTINDGSEVGSGGR